MPCAYVSQVIFLLELASHRMRSTSERPSGGKIRFITDTAGRKRPPFRCFPRDFSHLRRYSWGKAFFEAFPSPLIHRACEQRNRLPRSRL